MGVPKLLHPVIFFSVGVSADRRAVKYSLAEELNGVTRSPYLPIQFRCQCLSPFSDSNHDMRHRNAEPQESKFKVMDAYPSTYPELPRTCPASQTRQRLPRHFACAWCIYFPGSGPPESTTARSATRIHGVQGTRRNPCSGWNGSGA
jgi:hypothetical protein